MLLQKNLINFFRFNEKINVNGSSVQIKRDIW